MLYPRSSIDGRSTLAGMTRKKSKNDNVVEIDSQLYESVAILGMRMGRDDVTE